MTAATVRKWQSREQVQDLSHRPHRLSTTLTPGEEASGGGVRKTLMLPLDDLLVVTREFINPAGVLPETPTSLATRKPAASAA